MTYRAVIFDIGGVIFPAPFEAWAEYERHAGLEVGFIRRVIAGAGETGAWARLERSDVTVDEFVTLFEAECLAAGGKVSGAEVLARMGRRVAGPRAEMVDAIRAVRAHGLRTAALTNNWARDRFAGDEAGEERRSFMDSLFDLVVESSVIGLRKPDPRIYLYTCEKLGIEPPQAVFLDDLGMNLKPARALGMMTIKVADAGEAIAELESALGLPLR